MRTFIQPYLDGEDLRIFVSVDKLDNVKTKILDHNQNKYSLKQRFIKEISDCYRQSSYFRYSIVLFCKLIFDSKKKKEKLVFYDILLQSNYDGIQQSMRYNIRHDNLVFRFFNEKIKNCSVVQSFDIEDNTKMKIFEEMHFKYSTDITKVVYQLDVPYGFENATTEETVAHIETMKITGGKVGITKIETPESTEKNPVTEDKEFVEYFLCSSEKNPTEMYNVDISSIPMKDRISMIKYFEKDIEGRTCKCLVYSFWHISGRTFVEMN